MKPVHLGGSLVSLYISSQTAVPSCHSVRPLPPSSPSTHPPLESTHHTTVGRQICINLITYLDSVSCAPQLQDWAPNFTGTSHSPTDRLA